MRALRKIIAEVLSLPEHLVIEDRLVEGFTKGESGFVVVSKLQSKEVGMAELDFDGDKEQETITTTAETLVQVSAYGNNSLALIEKLRSLLQSTYAQEKLKKIKVGLITLSDVKNLTFSFAAGYEERANLDLLLSHEITIQAQQLVIKHVDVEVHHEHEHEGNNT